MTTLQLLAPAKINLFLHILRQREDRYHEIQTVFQFLDFCDDLNFSLRKDSLINIFPALENLETKDNLIYRAITLLQKKTGCNLGIDVELNKKIPMGAGLGGGSSDAATAMLAYNHLAELNLSLDELAVLGKELGADIPVFIQGKASWAEGIGEKLIPIVLPERWYVLIVVPAHANTAALYQDPKLNRTSAPLSMTNYHVDQGHNDFEPLVREKFPVVEEAFQWLSQFGKVHMSGSGVAIFSAFDSYDEAGRIAARAKTSWQTLVVRGLNQSPAHHWGVAKR